MFILQLTSIAGFNSLLIGLRKPSYAWMVFLVVLVGTACSRPTAKPSEDECLKHFIEKDVEAQLKLSQYNIPVSVDSVSGGSVKLNINATNERPLPDETIL